MTTPMNHSRFRRLAVVTLALAGVTGAAACNTDKLLTVPAASDGALMLTELEMLEPSLYLSYHPQAAQRFADAILKAVER